MNSFKIALCFLTYENLSQPELWSKIINNNKDKLNVYIHNKTDFIDTKYNLHKYCIKNKINTKYAHKSIVEATLVLFKEAYMDTNNSFFILLSDKCIPLYNFEYIYDQIFKLNSNIIYNFLAQNNSNGNIERFKNMKDKSFIDISKFVKDNQWLELNRETVNFFINNNFLHMYNDNFVALDEHYFGNICNKFNIPYINKKITYVNWDEKSDDRTDRSLPKTYKILTDDMIQNILKEDTLFLRKISSECKLPKYFDKLS